MTPFALTPYNYNRETYAWWDGTFNEDEINYLQNKAKTQTDFAMVGGADNGGSLVPEVRRSEITWLKNDQNDGWVFERLAHVVSSLNSQFFNFDLTCFGEAIQLTNYHEDYNGMYDWHVDFGTNTSSPCRKLSIVLQLTDPVDYEGGVLELKPHSDQAVKISKKKGLLVAFPSWTLHRVTPVTKGFRQTLVAWITGPAFK